MEAMARRGWKPHIGIPYSPYRKEKPPSGGGFSFLENRGFALQGSASCLAFPGRLVPRYAIHGASPLHAL